MSSFDLETYVLKCAKEAKQASDQLIMRTTEEKNIALAEMAELLWQERQKILDANKQDIKQAQLNGIPETRIDRLMIDEARIEGMIEGLHQLVALIDPVGEVIEQVTRPNGMKLEKVRVPFGVIGMVYESRPNVTVDAAGLAIKTGNAVVLRGGREALKTNQALVNALRLGLERANIPSTAIQLIERTERESVGILIRAKEWLDLVIPRGGAGLIQRVIEESLVPVIETGVGNCHLYVHEAANLKMAKEIAFNAKVQRPSVCNAIETLLVDQKIADDFLAQIVPLYREAEVEIRGCEKTNSIIEVEKVATEEDYAAEFLDLTIAVKVVKDLEEAIQHIHHYGTKHTEAIVTEDQQAAKQFLNRVDAAAVNHNVSTRFTDGFEYGLGAEIGISTQKLHARGPMGLQELTSYKYLVRGTGQIRE
ncbi:glutamate-5-semialdehyde dehydrogenase [Seinonella peptonophila]|uniref:Gamma-glutamyl phosphate reductase n=1 Tax=Seinonella peptonophila TaxID=112248 RepID=A0A1M4TWK3_9BACL|nr:glutamate-5-semialdehyde dehydrogenase [Seinonella peptonophila]SHE48829.1 glutamate-5-semialdehyde dehydrogenase [Seinonella peptonophila]